jgi:phosphoglycolate phosphatase
MRTPLALVLDFDGVVVDSVPIKSRAFRDCYPEATSDEHAAIEAHHHAHGGISRREKFIHFETALFGRGLDPDRIEALCRRYATLVYDAVVACRPIPGAPGFLAAADAAGVPMHLVSGTPETELRAIVAARGWQAHFESVTGAPTSKPAAFARIARDGGHAPEDLLAVGDSRTEFDAAEGLGMPFVGIVAPGLSNPFPPGIAVLPDLTGLAARLGLEGR